MSVRVVARIRPLLDNELDKDIIVRADSTEAGKPDTIVKVPNPKNGGEEFSFSFNAVYDQSTSQESLFTSEVAPHLKSLFQGYDVTLFAYGVTGTGKTHTMRGGLKLADRGVIPRLLSGVFRRSKKITKDSGGQTTVQVALSYYEIYNDKVFDLLEPPEKRTQAGLPLRAEANGRTVVAGLTERSCESLKDFEKMYIEANNNRVTAATKLNAHSSRSHAILRVKLTQTTGDHVRESTASAIDLAGSEDNRRTDNGKERLVESAAINKSLFVLSQCIDAIGRGDKRIPYRESKMTRILSLGQNNGITVMILNLAPLRSYHLDTLSSLNVSSRAKRIEVREIENEVVFKQFPKTSSATTVTGAPRHPLRPLANANNIHSGNVAAKATDAKVPVKAFSVYTDKKKPTSTRCSSGTGTNARRSGSYKRPSDQDHVSRPVKVPRPVANQLVTVSAAQIEAMVEKKVGEILAARSAAQAQEKQHTEAQPQPEFSDAVHKRLDALERRIEEGDRRGDSKSDGLRYLLSARQHKERGDDAAALKLYEMALPFFPGQLKLLGKIERLRARLENPAAAASASPGRDADQTPLKRRKKRKSDVDDSYHCDAEADVDEDFLDRPAKTKARKSKAKSKPKPTIPLSLPDGDSHIEASPPSPRTQNLLDVVNSRDPCRIKTLAGFGARKAQALVDYLDMDMDMDGGDNSNNNGRNRIENLAQLRALPGMGGKAIERAYEGLAV